MSNDLINKYNIAKQSYYNGEPIMTDEEFDSLEDYLLQNKLIELKVGVDVKQNKIKHIKPMLSLSKTRSIEDIIQFMNKSTEISNNITATDNSFLFATEKLDGSAVAIRYENGIPTTMLTRGDGKFGRNISEKINYLNIPKNIDYQHNFEVRGEIVITYNDYEKIKSEFNSIRNCVAGILNRKENYEQYVPYLTFIAYDIIFTDLYTENIVEYVKTVYDNYKILTEYEKFTLISDFGFRIPKYELINMITEIDYVINNLIKSTEYLTDGIVFTSNNLFFHNEYSEHSPKFKLAYKVINEIATTKIKKLNYSASVSGKISIVAEVEPVIISGATISNVTCYNTKTVLEQKLFPNAVIEIIRSGEIIPKIHKVLEPRTGKLITNCPTCNSELVMNSVDLVCENENCYSKISLRILKFVNLFGDKTKGISLATIEKLLDSNLISCASDLNSLKYEDLIKIDGFSDITANMIINAFKDLEITIKDIMIYCNLRLLGGKTIDKILDGTINITSLAYQVYCDNLRYINSVLQTFKSKNWKIVNRVDNNNTVYNKQSFVITGKLSKSRKEIEKDIKNFGYNISDSVNKDVILVCNEQDSNSSKMKKAKQLNIDIITEYELYSLYLMG